jgi:hypothetical protein
MPHRNDDIMFDPVKWTVTTLPPRIIKPSEKTTLSKLMRRLAEAVKEIV